MDGMHDAGDRCPDCSLKRAEWHGNRGRGHVLDDVRYCCQGCAEDTACTCFTPNPEAVGGGELRWDHHVPHSE